jgi:hypothetical protein
MDWSSSRSVFRLLSRWLSVEEHTSPILFGLVRSIGGKNNSRELLDDAIGAVTLFIDSNVRGNVQALARFGESLATFWEQHQSTNTSEIQSAGLYRLYEVIFATDIFVDAAATDSFATRMVQLFEKEYEKITRVSKSIERLAGFSTLLASFAPIQDSAARKKVFGLLTQQINNKFPVVRKSTCDALVGLISIYPHLIIQNDDGDVLKIARSIHWDTATDQEIRNVDNASKALGLDIAVTTESASAASSRSENQDLAATTEKSASAATATSSGQGDAHTALSVTATTQAEDIEF